MNTIKNIGVLLTCHNRKDKTIDCLNHLFAALKTTQDQLSIKVFLTDDGSTDGTNEVVGKLFPDIKLLKGNGNLFWAGGMRNSWNEALQYKFDAYLLLNDDTNVLASLFPELILTHKYAMEKYNTSGIYIGSTHDNLNKFSYGGSVVTNKLLNTYIGLPPNGYIQECDMGNANIMMVTQDVVSKIGILSNLYTHSLADFDYTLSAKRKNIPVLIAANYCGVCNRDHVDKYKIFTRLSFKDRKKFLFKPKGLALSEQLRFMKKFYPFRIPIIMVGASLKLLFPKIYIKLSGFRNQK